MRMEELEWKNAIHILEGRLGRAWKHKQKPWGLGGRKAGGRVCEWEREPPLFFNETDDKAKDKAEQ